MSGRGKPDILNNNYRRERAFCHRRPLRGQGEGMKLKTRVKLTVFFLVALVVVLNTGIDVYKRQENPLWERRRFCMV